MSSIIGRSLSRLEPKCLNLSLNRLVGSVSSAAPQDAQAKYMDEDMCIAVDTSDHPLRSISKRDCHFTSPVLHRAFSVFLFTNSGQMILQKRSPTKITFPCVWTNACCSHPLWNATEMPTGIDGGDLLGVRRAAQRKLKHELGIENADTDAMKMMGRFVYKAMYSKDWGEYELDYVIIIPNFNPSQIKENPDEVEQVALVDREQLKSMVESGALFSPWFRMLMERQWLNKWWNNLDRLAELEDLNSIKIFD